MGNFKQDFKYPNPIFCFRKFGPQSASTRTPLDLIKDYDSAPSLPTQHTETAMAKNKKKKEARSKRKGAAKALGSEPRPSAPLQHLENEANPDRPATRRNHSIGQQHVYTMDGRRRQAELPRHDHLTNDDEDIDSEPQPANLGTGQAHLKRKANSEMGREKRQKSTPATTGMTDLAGELVLGATSGLSASYGNSGREFGPKRSDGSPNALLQIPSDDKHGPDAQPESSSDLLGPLPPAISHSAVQTHATISQPATKPLEIPHEVQARQGGVLPGMIILATWSEVDVDQANPAMRSARSDVGMPWIYSKDRPWIVAGTAECNRVYYAVPLFTHEERGLLNKDDSELGEFNSVRDTTRFPILKDSDEDRQTFQPEGILTPYFTNSMRYGYTVKCKSTAWLGYMCPIRYTQSIFWMGNIDIASFTRMIEQLNDFFPKVLDKSDPSAQFMIPGAPCDFKLPVTTPIASRSWISTEQFETQDDETSSAAKKSELATGPELTVAAFPSEVAVFLEPIYADEYSLSIKY